MKHLTKKNILLAIIVIVVFLSGIFVFNKLHKPKIEPAIVNLETVQMQNCDNASLYQGVLISRQSVNIHPQVSGIVSQICVKAGDRVQKGQVLLIIDPKKQQAALNSIKNQRPSLISDCETTKIQYKRYTELYSKKTVSRQDLENYKAAYERAKSALDTNSAQIREQTEQLKYHYVTAPFSGIIGDVPVKTGDLVSPETVLLSVTQNEKLELNIGVQADKVYELKQGLTVQILDYDNNIVAESKIAFISPKVDSETQTILTKSYFKNPSGILKADQTVKTRVIFSTQKRIMLPAGSTTHIGGQDFTYIVKSENGQLIAHQIPVELGEIQNEKYIVKSGLSEGDIVVVKGIQKLYDGAPVKPEGK